MFKNRLFLFGLGIGLMAGAVLLQLMFKVDRLESDPLQQAQPPTVEQLQTQADKLNFKLVPKESTIYSDKDIAAIKQKAAEEERSKLAGQAAPPAKTVHTVFITEQMNAYQVADMFVNAGLLPDASGLVSGLKEKKLTTRIRAGSYSFEGPVTVDDVIAKITIAGP